MAALKRLDIRDVMVTDVSRDGTLEGPNLYLMDRFVKAGFRVTAAGGISDLNDIIRLNRLGVCAAVTGKAIYEGMLDLRQAQDAAAYKNGLTRRVIPCLDVKDGQVVKGTNFTRLQVVGSPVELAERYVRGGADELVFLDIAATAEGRKTFRGLVSDIARAIDVPFTVGGGINAMQDIRSLLGAGADKISLGTAAAADPGLVSEAAAYFGSQCIVVSVDAKRESGGWKVYIKGGSEPTGIEVADFCRDMQDRGAGELLINSLDRDGTGSGFDIELLKRVTEAVNIPVIASSGGGSPGDFARVFRDTGVDAALGASIFHYRGASPAELKCYLAKEGVEVRP
jgi:cyclase